MLFRSDVMHMLLQILEEGRLTDSLGRQIDFRNTVIILTSNLGFDHEKQGQGLGFARDAAAEDYDRLRDRMINSAKQLFKPELLNRLDDIIVFRKLDKTDVIKILDLELANMRPSLESKGIQLALDATAADLLVAKGFDTALGARPLRRVIERMLKDPLAEELLRGDITQGLIEVTASEDKQRLVFHAKKPENAKPKPRRTRTKKDGDGKAKE